LDIDFESEVLGNRRPYGEERRAVGVEADPAEIEKSMVESKSKHPKDRVQWKDWDDVFDKETRHEYTGNEGYPAECWYYTTAIVFWPRSVAFQVARSLGSCRFILLAELVEDAIARGASYGDQYVSELVRMLLSTASEIERDRTNAMIEPSSEDLKQIFPRLLKCINSIDVLTLVMRASIAYRFAFEEDMMEDVADAMVRVIRKDVAATATAATTAATATTGAAGATTGAAGAAVMDSRGSDATAKTDRKSDVSSDLIWNLKNFLWDLRSAEKAATTVLRVTAKLDSMCVTSATTPVAATAMLDNASIVVPNANLNFQQFIDKLALIVAQLIESRFRSSEITSLASLPAFLLFLASFDCCVSTINKILPIAAADEMRLTFSQHAAIISAMLVAPLEPPVTERGLSALVAVLSHCPLAFSREVAPNIPEVVWVFCTLLELSAVSTGRYSTQRTCIRSIVEALAEAMKAHPQSDALLKLLLTNADVQAAIRRGDDDTCRHLCEHRVQQLDAAASSITDTHAGDGTIIRFPKAVMPAHLDVEAFLRGPAPTYTVIGLDGIEHARRFVAEFCTGQVRGGYCIVGEPHVGDSRMPRDGYVNIRKKHPFHAELEKLRQLLL
jgi:hypothetical protein